MIVLTSFLLIVIGLILATNPRQKAKLSLSRSDVRVSLSNHYFRIAAQPKKMRFSADLDYESEEIPGFYLHFAAAKPFSLAEYLFTVKFHCLWLAILVLPVFALFTCLWARVLSASRNSSDRSIAPRTVGMFLFVSLLFVSGAFLTCSINAAPLKVENPIRTEMFEIVPARRTDQATSLLGKFELLPLDSSSLKTLLSFRRASADVHVAAAKKTLHSRRKELLELAESFPEKTSIETELNEIGSMISELQVNESKIQPYLCSVKVPVGSEANTNGFSGSLKDGVLTISFTTFSKSHESKSIPIVVFLSDTPTSLVSDVIYVN